MEHHDEINEIFLQLEEADYHGDRPLVYTLSRKIHKMLKERGDVLRMESPADAANMFLSSSEMIRDQDFHEAISLVHASLDCLQAAAKDALDRADHDVAAEHFKKIAEIHDELLEDTINARAYLSIVVEHIERYMERHPSPSMYTHHYSLAELHASLENWKQAEHHVIQALNMAKENGRFFMVATAYQLLLKIKQSIHHGKEMLDRFLEARAYFQQVLNGIESSSKRNNFMEIAEVYHVFAGFYDLMEDNEEFRSISLKEADCYLNMARAREHDDDVGAAIYYHSAALVLQKINKEEACTYFLASARRYESAGILDSAADNLLMASCCMEDETNQLGRVIALVQEAVSLLSSAGYLELALANLRNVRSFLGFLEDSREAGELERALTRQEMEVLQNLASGNEGREAAQYHVEMARILMTSRNKDTVIDHLKSALDLFKVSHSMNPSSSARNCIDMLAIVMIAIVLDRSNDVDIYDSMLELEGQKTPFGKYIAAISKNMRNLLAKGALVNHGIVVASPVLRNLLAIAELNFQ